MRSATALLTPLVAAALLSGLAGCGTGAASAGGAAPSAGSSGSSNSTDGSSPVAAGTPSAGPLARSVPVRLEIPSIGVDTPVIPLALASDGSVDVPPIEAHSPAGWYQGSPTPGQVGPSVILAHVTVGQYGDGVFLHLARLKPGDRVVAMLQNGASAVFTVDSVQTVAKSRFPTSAVYGNVNHPALRLITCGGPRGSGRSGYPDNVVVYASLASASR
ncbi:LPXTG-site transpeptidase (sortase) family protein [Streptacidiphilus sp. MAP12-16]|uniref:class F sortase n=1 Tax=Streptacidiphilus sp. MAP12-16 TaxID=3156300 RepID=UPI0035171077